MNAPYAELLVDTAHAPGALGQRAACAGDRQLVYRHAGLQLELMLQAGDAVATFVWGQLSRAASGRPCGAARIELLDEDSRRVAESETDAFGEFSLAAPRVVEGSLAVETAAGRFLCWLAPRERELPAPGPRAPSA
jgi:hypothetical protein